MKLIRCNKCSKCDEDAQYNLYGSLLCEKHWVAELKLPGGEMNGHTLKHVTLLDVLIDNRVYTKRLHNDLKRLVKSLKHKQVKVNSSLPVSRKYDIMARNKERRLYNQQIEDISL